MNASCERTIRRLCAPLAAIWLFGTNPAAHAEDYPNLKGTWKGTSASVLLGSHLHGTGDPERPVTLAVDATLTLTDQEGGLIWGTIASADASEPWLGVIRADRTSIFAADSDGYINGSVVDENTLELCYARAGESIVAGCVDFYRQ